MVAARDIANHPGPHQSKTHANRGPGGASCQHKEQSSRADDTALPGTVVRPAVHDATPIALCQNHPRPLPPLPPARGPRAAPSHDGATLSIGRVALTAPARIRSRSGRAVRKALEWTIWNGSGATNCSVSAASRSCSSVVPDRGGPSTNTGRSHRGVDATARPGNTQSSSPTAPSGGAHPHPPPPPAPLSAPLNSESVTTSFSATAGARCMCTHMPSSHASHRKRTDLPARRMASTSARDTCAGTISRRTR